MHVCYVMLCLLCLLCHTMLCKVLLCVAMLYHYASGDRASGCQRIRYFLMMRFRSSSGASIFAAKSLANREFESPKKECYQYQRRRKPLVGCFRRVYVRILEALHPGFSIWPKLLTWQKFTDIHITSLWAAAFIARHPKNNPEPVNPGFSMPMPLSVGLITQRLQYLIT